MISLFLPLNRRRGLLSLGAGLLWMGGCAVGPNYQKADLSAITPVDWRWKNATPQETESKGAWWEIFGESELNRLEQLALQNNQNLKAAVTRVDEARARARIGAAEFFPMLSADPSAIRTRNSINAPNPTPFKLLPKTQTAYSMPLDLSYEIDLWGRVRRSFESSRAQAEAQVADYQNVMLILTSDIAYNYFLISALDAELAVLARIHESQKAGLEVTELRFKSGLGREVDYQQARTEVAESQAERIDTQRLREETANIIALLCGQSASTFTISTKPLRTIPPSIPSGLPSALLERRPDIAQAERLMAARNAEIGVAYAAFFPSISITGQGGVLSADTSNLYNWESRFWSIGPSVSLPIFAGGRNVAGVNEARAAYEESVARYRQSVLTAFKEVEDALLQITKRREQLAAKQESLDAARRASQLSKERYEQGATTYLEVVQNQRTEFQIERSLTGIRGQQLNSTVRLIKALGGGWGDRGKSR